MKLLHCNVVWHTVTDVKERNRNKALDALRTLRAAGARSATFNPDGSLASVELGPLTVSAKSLKPPGKLVPFTSEPPMKRSDLDALDDLPSYETEADRIENG